MLDIKFIKYPMTFTTSPHVRLLIKNYGYEIVGRMMALFETLNEMDNKFEVDNEMDYESIKAILGFKKNMDFDNFLSVICKTSDFKLENKIISSKIISDTEDEMKAKSEKARESVKKRWEKNTNEYDRITNVIPTNTIREEKIRIDKIRPDENREDEMRKEHVEETARAFNEITKGFLPSIQTVTDERKKHLNILLKKYSIEKIREAFEKIPGSDFLCGRLQDKHWKADFDFIIKEKNFVRLLEGTFDTNRYANVSKSIRSVMEVDLNTPAAQKMKEYLSL